MPARRKSTVGPSRASAREATPSLRDQLAQMERAFQAIHRTLNVQFKRIAALQAQVDHLAAKIASRYVGL